MQRRRTPHEARLPMQQRLAPPFAYDPQSGMVIAPWQRGELPPDDEPRLCAVLDQIAAFNGGSACRAGAQPPAGDDPLFRRVGLNLDEP
jgi:hypothetical protein